MLKAIVNFQAGSGYICSLYKDNRHIIDGAPGYTASASVLWALREAKLLPKGLGKKMASMYSFALAHPGWNGYHNDTLRVLGALERRSLIEIDRAVEMFRLRAH